MPEAKAKRAPKAPKEPAVKKETPSSSETTVESFSVSRAIQIKAAPAKTEDSKAAATPKEAVVDDTEGWFPAHHPVLSTSPALYYINKNGQVAKKTNKMEIRDRNETYSAVSLPTYRLKNKNGTHSNVPIAEMMAQTFVGVFPDNKTHYIFYKDGVPNNCTMANLTVCSFSELQALERQRLETEYSGVKFTVVKTDDDLLTRYLVGDNGQVYDIIKHSFRKVVERTPTRFLVRLEGSDSGRYIQVSQVVLESFVGPCEKGYRIVHLDGDSSNNTLENLKYMTKRQHTLWQHKVNPPAYTPSPPVTKDTKWAPVGTLPWNKISYPLYEVSNMGHVRLKDSKELIKIQRTVKTAAVSMEHGKNADGTPQMHVERVARLVANCFVTPGYTATRCFVKHLNRDRHDNTSKNLQWVEQRAALTRPPPLKVVVKLLDEPATQKSFDSKAKAAKKLKEKSILSIRRGDSAKKTVFWDNRYRDTIVQIL